MRGGRGAEEEEAHRVDEDRLVAVREVGAARVRVERREEHIRHAAAQVGPRRQPLLRPRAHAVGQIGGERGSSAEIKKARRGRSVEIAACSALLPAFV